MNLSLSLLGAFIFSIKIALSTRLDYIFLLPLIFVLLLKRASILKALKALVVLNIFILFLALSAFINENYHLALLIIIRANLILFFTLLLFCKENLYKIAQAFYDLRLSSKLSFIFYFSAKFIQDLCLEFMRLKKTLKTRAFRHKSSLFAYKIYANCVAMLFISAIYKSQKLEYALICRNFKLKLYRFEKFSFSLLDCVFLGLILAMFCFSLGVFYE
ncbi:CbiQ family ECF transporter T component [Campylobacter sp. MIT 12-5580]|uniref:CbiQ family ECF transporter T component n=1 Tax=Campylobacter sp. MIT 12-5580 TaxID=2040651 RepID=UPI0014858ADB|nr:CbiQ family ECF transporter T component [Campylobacter sp. MIT 12-5580]